MSASLRKIIQKKFKIRSYVLKVDALEGIISFVSGFPGAEDDAIDCILDYIEVNSETLAIKSSVIDGAIIEKATSVLAKCGDPNEDCFDYAASRDCALRIIDVFKIKKFRYDSNKKRFYHIESSLPDASTKAALYRDRFMLLSQRTSRDEHFARPTMDSGTSHYGSCEIVPIQSLVGQTETKWVMGLISQLEDGHFYLEDLTASVEIDLSKARITTGFLTENTIIVAEGHMLPNNIFEVLTCGFPPLEDRDKSLKAVAPHDFFTGEENGMDDSLRLAEMEKDSEKDMFVILSDIWLDKEEVIEKLNTVLDGYENEEVVPSLFVFMGNFSSHSCHFSFPSFSSLRSQFKKLGDIIGSHSRLKEESQFLFIPGPGDVGPSSDLPLFNIVDYFADEIRDNVPKAIFSSNPCRLKSYTQEIVFFRQDLLYRMRRACLLPPSKEETEDMFEHLVATITHQSHLCPLPLVVQPIKWNYDHCLHLYPLPHTIVLGDVSEQKAFQYSGVTCINTGSFSIDSTFIAYRPFNQQVELSSL